ncbi:MAG: hypothetical protein LUE98_01745 [Tannerellaceae bacterium]|nr:hypothetical protein [Tannerellaceae bacterium]
MYKIYFRQAIQMLRQNPVMSAIAITGTALAIMMIMAIIVSEEIKNISVAPEIHRARTYYLHDQLERDTARNNTIRGNIKFSTYKEYLTELKTPEAICAVTSFNWGHEKNYSTHPTLIILYRELLKLQTMPFGIFTPVLLSKGFLLQKRL